MFLVRLGMAIGLVLPTCFVGQNVHAAAYDAILYGKAGTFGTLGTTTPSGRALTKIAVPGWQFEGGQEAYVCTASQDGTVFIGNIMQSYQQLIPTASNMVISILNTTAGNESFSNLVVVNGLGSFQGEDIGDVMLALNSSGSERVYFTSLAGSFKQNRPAFGALRKSGTSWVVDFTRTSTDLHNSSAAGAAACQNFLHGNGATYPDCEGLNTLAELPASGHLVVTQYFNAPYPVANRSGGLLVISKTGVVQSYYRVPPHPLPAPTPVPAADCGQGGPALIGASPLVVSADPTSQLGDERFIIGFENRYAHSCAQCQAIQEFRYNDFTKTISEVSAPIFPTSINLGACNPSAQLTGGNHDPSKEQVLNAGFDHQGNLFVARARGFAGVGPVDVFVRDPNTGKRKLETSCSSGPYGTSCSADQGLGQTGFAIGVLEDVVKGTVYVVGRDAKVSPIHRDTGSANGYPFSMEAGYLYDIGDLDPGPPPPPNTATIAESPWIEPTLRQLYVPVGTIEGTPYPDNVVRNNWLYAIKLPGC